MPIPLEKIVEEALKAGFVTELQVASTVSKATWTPHQNVYFIDKDEGKGREFDLKAHKMFWSTKEKPEVSCLIALCIEVKKTSEPFVFYSSKKGFVDDPSGYGILHWKQNVGPAVLGYNDIEKHRPLSDTKRLARSYSCLKTGQTQHIQSGIISAFKAAIHECDNCFEAFSDTSGDICFFVPVMVVDGPMYECYFEDEGHTPIAREVNEIVYLQNYHSKNYGRVSNSVHV